MKKKPLCARSLLSALLLLTPALTLAAPAPAALPTLEIDVRGSMMSCFFGGYIYTATVVSGEVPLVGGPPLMGSLHVGLGDEGRIDPLALGGVFRAKVQAASPLADGTCAIPSLMASPDLLGHCWALSDASPVEGEP